jgi:hypothetical protein
VSRNFEAQVEVFPCTAERCPAITEVLGQWGMEVAGDCESFDDNYPDGWAFWGAVVLAGGQTERDKHEGLRRLLPGMHIISRWRWVDELPWDEEFFSEPLTCISPAA